MLSIDGIQAGYGTARVLFGVSLSVGEGEVVALSGRNGMGKTTTLRCMLGILRPTEGGVSFMGRSVCGLPPHEIVRAGIAYVPEGRHIFAGLSVIENLRVARTSKGPRAVWNLDTIWELFPALWDRRHNAGLSLSGGEQQMLAIGRALVTNPRLLVLDEATEGLAPMLRVHIWRVLEKLKAMGQAIVVVDKHLASIAALADRHYLLEKGRVVWTGSSPELLANQQIQRTVLGV